MRYLRKFNESQIEFPSSIEEAERVFEDLRIQKSRVIHGLTFNIDGSVDYEDKGLSQFLNGLDLIKLPVRFRHVDGLFDISWNRLLTLEGCPDVINGSLFANKNLYTSLEGGPRIVTEAFISENGRLETLKGCPEEIGDTFQITGNSKNLKEIDYLPKVVRGYIWTNNNYHLYHVPAVKDGDYLFHMNSFKNCPIEPLFRVFYDKGGINKHLSDQLKSKDFIRSLDYNYIRFINGEYCVVLHRFLEAIDEIDYKLEKSLFIEITSSYKFVDDSGNVIDESMYRRPEELQQFYNKYFS